MEESLFFRYVSSLLQETGHMMQTAPIYANQSMQTVLYIENDRTVSLSKTDCAMLSYVSHISLLTQLEWGETDTVQLYAITAHFPHRHRSQNIAETHRLLQATWQSRHSIVFFQNEDMWAVSFADDTTSHVLSDWFSFETDDEEALARLSIENMSLSDSTAYFLDFQYAMAREYYRYPISRSEARYALLPRDYRQTKYNEDAGMLAEDSVSAEEFRSLFQEGLFYYEFQYGNDYVAPHHTDAVKAEVTRQAKEAAECEARETLERQATERQAKEEAIRQVALVLQQIIEKAKLAEIERQLHETMISRIAGAYRQIVARAEKIEAAEREARETLERQAKERQAKEEAIRQVALVLQQIIEKAKLAEIERQLHETMTSRIAGAYRQIVARAEKIEVAEREARETLERQAKEEAERLAREAMEKREQMRRVHEERVQQLQKQCTMEMNTVQSALSAVTRRLSEIEQSMSRLHIFQFSKKKAMIAEQSVLQEKEKQLRLLLTKIENSFQKQLDKENDTYAQTLSKEEKP